MSGPGPVYRLPRGVRLHRDNVRAREVLLGPERALFLDDIGFAVLNEVDGLASLDAIAGRLALRFDAPVEVIRPDVAEFLSGLRDKWLIEEVR